MKLPYIATLGGHSALEICSGAKKLGFKTLVVVQKGRDKTYTRYFHNLIDESIVVDNFSQLTSSRVIEKLKEKNCLFVPHRYLQVYCDLENIEKRFPIPVFGNKFLLKYEDRTGRANQYQLLEKAQVDYPLQFKDPKGIDRLSLVKVSEAQRGYERAFFFARNYAEYKSKVLQLIKRGRINKDSLSKAVIEEYLLGAQINFNFFYSPLNCQLQMLGTDIRRQTNIDGLIRLPSSQQAELSATVNPSYIEAGHIAVTVKESLLEQAFSSAEKLIKAVKTYIPPGIIGPFALQSVIVPGPPREKIVIYDLSLRIPGSPGITATPYSGYLYGYPVSFGERIAMEILQACDLDKIMEVTT